MGAEERIRESGINPVNLSSPAHQHRNQQSEECEGSRRESVFISSLLFITHKLMFSTSLKDCRQNMTRSYKESEELKLELFRLFGWRDGSPLCEKLSE